MQTQTVAKIQERRRRKVGRDSMESLNCAPFASFCGFCFAEHGFRPYCLKMPTVVFRTCSPVIFSRPFFFSIFLGQGRCHAMDGVGLRVGRGDFSFLNYGTWSMLCNGRGGWDVNVP